jgi:hypothetical protein
MANPLVRDHYIRNVRKAVDDAKGAALIGHQGLAGTLREIFVGNLLQPLIPPGFGIGRGKVIDSNGGSSAECDVIIYNRSILPPILYDEKLGVFPIEACIYAIEVKSTLTSTELDDTIRKCRQLWSLTPMRQGDYRPRTALFAFGSDLTSKGELERYLEKDGPPYPTSTPNPACLVMCVVGRSYSCWMPHKNACDDLPLRHEFDEVVGFLSGVANSLILHTKHREGLPFGYYLMNPAP